MLNYSLAFFSIFWRKKSEPTKLFREMQFQICYHYYIGLSPLKIFGRKYRSSLEQIILPIYAYTLSMKPTHLKIRLKQTKRKNDKQRFGSGNLRLFL